MPRSETTTLEYSRDPDRTRWSTTDAFAAAKRGKVLCLAHVTNTMGHAGEDFEKGEADGTADALAVLETIVAGIGL